MPKTKSHNSNKPDSYEARLVAAQSFTPGNRVRHRVTGQLGFFQETNLGFALPEVWVEFDSNTDSRISVSCNPLELELVNENYQEHQFQREPGLLGSAELVEADSRDVEVLPPVMTETEARQCIEAIKEHVVSLRRLLVELEDRRGWEALGYSSTTACMVAEFNNSKPVLVRELKVGRIEKHHLQVPIGTYLESQLRPLSKLQPEQYKPAITKAHELAGFDKLTAVHVAKAVNELLRPTRFVAQQPSKFQRSDLIRIKCAVGALPEQKAWDGCWAIVQSVGNISCVRVLVGSKEVDYMVGDLDWDDNSDPQFRDVSERILTLWQTELEPIEQTVLKELQHRHFFTDLELQMISLMEAKRL